MSNDLFDFILQMIREVAVVPHTHKVSLGDKDSRDLGERGPLVENIKGRPKEASVNRRFRKTRFFADSLRPDDRHAGCILNSNGPHGIIRLNRVNSKPTGSQKLGKLAGTSSNISDRFPRHRADYLE